VKFGRRFWAKAHTAFLVVLGKVRLRLETETQIHHRMGKLAQRDIDGLLSASPDPSAWQPVE
jgi:hypothetical protein